MFVSNMKYRNKSNVATVFSNIRSHPVLQQYSPLTFGASILNLNNSYLNPKKKIQVHTSDQIKL